MILFEGNKKTFVIEQVNRLTDSGITKAEIARRLEVSPQFINSITKTDKSVSSNFFHKFVTTFDLSKEVDKYTESINQDKPSGLVEEQRIPYVQSEKEEQFDYLIDNLFSMLKEKDQQITDLSEEVGRLKSENDRLRNE